MTQKSFFLLGLIFFISHFFVFSQKIDNGAKYCSQKKMSRKTIFSNDELSAKAPKHSFDVLHYNLSLDIKNCFLSPYPKNFAANVMIKFKVDSTLNSITLNAINSSLQIDSVRMAAVSFTHTNNKLRITLNQSYFPNDTVSVKIFYKHKNVSDNHVYVRDGMFFTDCEPEGARYWFPSWDKPSDKATFELTAKTPTNVKLGSNGHLQDSTVLDNSIIYHWVSRDKIATYLISIAAKVNFQLHIVNWTSPSGQNVPIRFYYNSGEDPSAIENIIGDVANFFSDRFTEHPFEKNGFATLNSDFAWGGMENQTLTSLCPNCWSEDLIVHEFAHQWFGDMITCATWGDLWINEGWATYLTALWKEHAYGYSAYRNEIESKANDYLWGNPGWAISNPSWSTVTPPTDSLFNYSITYAKGACVLHLLRYVLGDSLFLDVTKQYANDLNFKYKNASIRDFNGKVNQISGRNYNWFFDQWIYQPNHPVYENQYHIRQEGCGSRWRVAFYTEQTQTNAPFFRMPLEVNIHFADNTDTTLRLENTYNKQLFSYLFDKEPNQVTFDPHNKIVLKEASLSLGSPKNLTLNKIGNGIIDPVPGNYSYAFGAEIILMAFPDSGWHFEKWQISGMDDVLETSVSVPMTENRTVTAIFEQNIPPYELKISKIGNGLTSPQVGTYIFQNDTIITLNATPAAGYRFIQWIINSIVVNTATFQLTINQDKRAVAHFEKVDTLTIEKEGNGTTTPNMGRHDYVRGTNVALSAVADNGWHFVKWQIAGQSQTSNPFPSVLVDTNKTAKAFFEKTIYNLKIEKVGQGTLSLDTGNYQHFFHDTIPLSCTPNEGWFFVKWVINGQNFLTPNQTLILEENTTATAYFEKIIPVLTISKIGNGTTTPQEGVYIKNFKDTVNISAIPSQEWKFSYFVANQKDTMTENPLILIMENSKNVVAHFDSALFTISVKKFGEGYTQPDTGIYEINVGKSVHFAAESETGFRFEKWILNKNDTIFETNFDITVTENVEAIAYFVEVKRILQIQKLGNGQTLPDTGKYLHKDGDFVTLDATPQKGWEFSKWNIAGEGDILSISTSINMDTDKIATCVFEKIPYSLAISKIGKGTISPVEGNYTHFYHDSITFAAVADSGWKFNKWILNSKDSVLQNNFVLKIDSTTEIAAIFSEKTNVEHFLESEIKIFPNPATDKFSISLNFELTEPVNLKILSLTGKIIFEKQIFEKQTLNNLPVIPSGMYILILENEKMFISKRLIINR